MERRARLRKSLLGFDSISCRCWESSRARRQRVLIVIFQRLSKAYRPAFAATLCCLLDVRELEPDGMLAAANAFTRASTAGIAFTPVTGISRTVDVAPAIACGQTSGVGIRLTRLELEAGNLAASVNRFMSANNLSPGRVDLIVDLGPVEDLITAGIVALSRAFLENVPNKSQWRTLTVTGSAFPLSMGVVNRNSSARIERSRLARVARRSVCSAGWVGAVANVQRLRNSAPCWGRELRLSTHASVRSHSVYLSE